MIKRQSCDRRPKQDFDSLRYGGWIGAGRPHQDGEMVGHLEGGWLVRRVWKTRQNFIQFASCKYLYCRYANGIEYRTLEN